MRLDEIARYRLAHLPTPLEPLARLQEELGGGPRLFIKRDDCTGLALGGNKTRKLEFLIADALAAGASAVVTEGGLQSNHVRQTAAASARARLACHLVLDHRVPIDRKTYRTGGNMLLDRLLGATVHVCGPNETRAQRVERLAADLRARGETPYLIPAGGSNGIGALGYAALMGELAGQAAAQGLAIDHVLVASSSGGTQAGLIVGAALAERSPAIIGVDIDGEPDELRGKVREVAAACAARLGLSRPFSAASVEIAEGYAPEGYGVPNPGMIEAVTLLARLEGILLDPVYTGKAMAGLIDMIGAKRFDRHETVVFIHTGGMPALFAYEDCFR
jgi:L-cysteate sulfo-lyase